MMAHVDETDRADRTEALLWAAPTGPLPAPPIDTKAQVLPIGDLHWPDAERLFLRLLHTVRPVQYAKLFGVPGQAQAGIDAYARLPLDLTDGGTGGRDYITLQSRRIKSLTAAKIKKTVDDLLKGEWADKTSAFHFATSFDLQDTKLDAAIRQQTERLAIGAKARTTPDICCLARDLRHFLRHAHGDRALRCSPGPAVHHTGIRRSPIAAPPSDRARCTCYPSACRPLQPPARGYGQ